MQRINLKKEIFPLLVIAVSIVASFYFYAHFPATVTTHWNFQGQPNGYSGRAFGAFFFPALIAGIYLLFLALPALDPKRERYQEFIGPYNIFKNLLVLFMAFIYFLMGIYNMGYQFNVGVWVSAAVGVLIVIMGNYMGKLKPNWFVGIKTPWTLSSENVWTKTHQVGGRLMMLFGLIIIISPWLPVDVATVLFIGGAVAFTLGSIVYSYWLYRQEKKQS